MAQNGRDDCTTADAADDEARATLIVAAQTADSQCDDRGKTDGFKEEDQVEHCCG